MGVFGRLFGSDEAIHNITDKEQGLVAKAGGWFDRLEFTDEEKEENRLAVRRWGLKQLDALQPFKVVQRILAFSIAFLWVLVGLNVLVAIWLGGGDPDYLVREAMLEFAFSDYIFWPVSVCFGLYFGGGLVESIRRKEVK